MQLTYQKFKEYLKADLSARKQNISLSSLIIDPISRFHFYLRFLEFSQNRKIALFFFIIIKYLFLRLSMRLGFSIPINTIGKGVYLPHYGTIVINSAAWVGENATINVDVVIGRHPSSKKEVPTIGENVYIGPGAKIFGNVEIGKNSKIGANAVVNRSFPNDSILVGVPARDISAIDKSIT